MPESWSSPESPSQRSRLRRGPDPLEQGLDRLVSAGRQLVDGVSGARPGVRGPSRGGPSRGASASASASLRPRLDQLGRWVEDKLDWILDEEEDWREPWQEPAQSPTPQPSQRRPLEAISRRMATRSFAAPKEFGPPPADLEDGWPDEDTFTVPRWRRDPLAGRGADPLSQPNPSVSQTHGSQLTGRPLPRSSRSRTG